MPKPSRGSARAWLLPIVLVLPLWSCLVIVSTAPGIISGATIVFVAFDDHGAFVAATHVMVADTAGEWRQSGSTGTDGSFRCTLGLGVTRVRMAVTPPAGYSLAGGDGWPRELDVPSDGSVRVEVRVVAGRP
jgi:hypothetical protein